MTAEMVGPRSLRSLVRLAGERFLMMSNMQQFLDWFHLTPRMVSSHREVRPVSSHRAWCPERARREGVGRGVCFGAFFFGEHRGIQARARGGQFRGQEWGQFFADQGGGREAGAQPQPAPRVSKNGQIVGEVGRSVAGTGGFSDRVGGDFSDRVMIRQEGEPPVIR